MASSKYWTTSCHTLHVGIGLIIVVITSAGRDALLVVGISLVAPYYYTTSVGTFSVMGGAAIATE
jgi:hypothetical protein